MKDSITPFLGDDRAAVVEARATALGITGIWEESAAQAATELGEGAAPDAIGLRAAIRAQQRVGLRPVTIDPAPSAPAAEEKPARKKKAESAE